MELAEIKDCVKDHERRIKTLEINDATTAERLTTMLEKIGSLTKALWWLGTAIFASLLGYFIKMMGG